MSNKVKVKYTPNQYCSEVQYFAGVRLSPGSNELDADLVDTTPFQNHVKNGIFSLESASPEKVVEEKPKRAKRASRRKVEETVSVESDIEKSEEES